MLDLSAQIKMSDEELSSWYKDFCETAAAPNDDVKFHGKAHTADAVTVDVVRAKLLSFNDQVWPEGAGSPWHNVWHWIHG